MVDGNYSFWMFVMPVCFGEECVIKQVFHLSRLTRNESLFKR